MSTSNILGVIGGTFDPVHHGHLIAAEYARYELGMNRVMFVPAGHPPHKQAEGISCWEHRYRMMELAIQENEYFEISPMENLRMGYSYTVDTIEYLKQTHPDSSVYFIMGADSLLTIDTWKDYRRLTQLCRFVVVTRPGYLIQRTHPALVELPEAWWKTMCQVEIPAVDISSTNIRERVAAGKPIRYLLPMAVEQYIQDHNLYRGGA